ncbi:Uma2 family endonuclease [Edaphobacter bradus]|uniref:Uma2 family endonuclease n=1 Tax=Edaphobacter bradus TaxID=2259016 RepID=UPI0021E059B1|nr:Uma2 family endonuclease [Edaphobacter bradus]
MAGATLIPVSEYLSTTYRPDRDYIDGELRERNVGDRPHAVMQALLATIFNVNRRTWGVVGMTELRIQTSATHFRIPGLCILRRSDPVEDVVRTAPLICIEIISPSDTLSALQERVDDYIAMGVDNVWVIDPLSRHAYVASSKGFETPSDEAFSVPGTTIRIALEELFAEFDEMQQQS